MSLKQTIGSFVTCHINKFLCNGYDFRRSCTLGVSHRNTITRIVASLIGSAYRRYKLCPRCLNTPILPDRTHKDLHRQSKSVTVLPFRVHNKPFLIDREPIFATISGLNFSSPASAFKDIQSNHKLTACYAADRKPVSCLISVSFFFGM